MVLLQIDSSWLFSLSSFVGGGALGGLLSAVIYHKENRRMKKSEAAQREAAAKKEDASAAGEMMGLLERTVVHMERMNSYHKTNAESLLQMLTARDDANCQLNKDLELLQLQRTEDHRRITGLEKTVKRELAWRKDGDLHYCVVQDCKRREPPMGTLKR